MTTAQLTPRAQAVIAASDEYTDPIFRAPSVGCSGKSDCQHSKDVGMWPEHRCAEKCLYATSASGELPAWWSRFIQELTLQAEDAVRADLPGILEVCALDAMAALASHEQEGEMK